MSPVRSRSPAPFIPRFYNSLPSLRLRIRGRFRVSGLHGRGLVVFFGHLAVNVGPELLYHVGNRVIAHLRSPYAGSIRKRAVGCIVNINHRVRRGVVASGDKGARMVGVGGDGGRQGAAKNFGVVELRVAGIGARDNDSADRITSAAPESAFAGLKKSWILVQQ